MKALLERVPRFTAAFLLSAIQAVIAVSVGLGQGNISVYIGDSCGIRDTCIIFFTIYAHGMADGLIFKKCRKTLM